jgi:hypothetical protein
LTIGCSSVRRCEALLRYVKLQLRILCLWRAPRDDHATQAVPSELASLKGEAGVHNPAAGAPLRLLQLIIFDREVREIPRRGLVRFLMHLLDIDVVHLVLVELIRGDVNRGQGQVEDSQAIASRSCDLVIKDVNLQVMYAELGGVLCREILQGLDKDGGAARGIDIAPFDVDDPAFLSVGGGLQPLSINAVSAWL